MENPPLSKNSVACGLALVITCLVNSIIVVVKEKSETVMNGMKQLTGHHWITHSILVLVIFAALSWLFGRANGGQGMKTTAQGLISTLAFGVGLAAVIIVGFYLVAD